MTIMSLANIPAAPYRTDDAVESAERLKMRWASFVIIAASATMAPAKTPTSALADGLVDRRQAATLGLHV
jgi:hypothetical protein